MTPAARAHKVRQGPCTDPWPHGLLIPGGGGFLQSRDPPLELGPVVPDGFPRDLLYPGEGRERQHHLPDPDHVLPVVVPYQGEQPPHHLGVPVLGDLAGHDPHGPALVGLRYPFPEDPVEVGILLVQVHVEVEPEGGRGTGGLQAIPCGIRLVQGLEGFVQAPVVFLIGFGDQGSDTVDGREDGLLLSLRMPDKDLVEEPVPLDIRGNDRPPPGEAEGSGRDRRSLLCPR